MLDSNFLLPLASLSILLLFPLAWLLRRRFHLSSATKLKNKTVLITGCDSGYGHSLALHCASLGMRVFATCLEKAEGWAALAKVEGVTVLPLDITSRASRANLVEQVSSLLAGEGLHCLVNNAAVLVFAEAAWQTEQQVKHQVEVNMVGPLLLTRAFITHLSTGRGRVINMISNCTTCPLPTLAVYTASKYGLLALSEGMRPEVEKYGVQVVIVNPGDAPFTTALTAGQHSHYQKRPSLQRIVDSSFYSTMENAMGAKKPREFYDNSPTVTKVLFTIIKALPRRMADKARLKLMFLPEFQRS